MYFFMGLGAIATIVGAIMLLIAASVGGAVALDANVFLFGAEKVENATSDVVVAISVFAAMFLISGLSILWTVLTLRRGEVGPLKPLVIFFGILAAVGAFIFLWGGFSNLGMSVSESDGGQAAYFANTTCFLVIGFGFAFQFIGSFFA